MNVDVLISLVIHFSVSKCHTVYNCACSLDLLNSSKKFVHKEIVTKSTSVITYDSTASKMILKKALSRETSLSYFFLPTLRSIDFFL